MLFVVLLCCVVSLLFYSYVHCRSQLVLRIHRGSSLCMVCLDSSGEHLFRRRSSFVEVVTSDLVHGLNGVLQVLRSIVIVCVICVLAVIFVVCVLHYIVESVYIYCVLASSRL